NKQIEDVGLWANQQILAMQKAKTYSLDAYNAIQAKAGAMVDNIIQKQLEADTSTKAHAQMVADTAKAAYDFATQHADQYTTTRLAQLKTESDAAQQALLNWSANAVDAIQQVKAPVDATVESLKRASDAMETLQGGSKLP